MDMQDKETEFVPPGVMQPDNTMLPAEPELSEMTGGATVIPPPGTEKEEKPTTPLQDSLRRLRRDRRAMISLGIIVFFVVIAFIGPPIYQHIGGTYQSAINGAVGADQYHGFSFQAFEQADQLPSAQHWLGTDNLGRDLLARLMQGVLISIVVAVLVETVDIVVGIFVGILAGYYGGWIDQFLARFTDIMFAFPGLLFLILVAGILGDWADTTLSKIPIVGPNGNARLLLVSLALALTIWPLMARYVRGQTFQLKEQQFVEAARTSGTSDARIIFRHIIPNLFSIVVIASTLDIVNIVITEAAISYLGLGVRPPGSSIGLMIADGSPFISTHPWEPFLPCLVLVTLVLSFSFLGDGLRDAFDPRSKG